MGKAIEKPKLLLVEGRDEEEFFGALLTSLGIEDIEVRPIAGKSRLSDRLKVLVQGPRTVPIGAVGIVQDADNDAAAAFQSIRTALMGAGLPVPNAPQRLQEGVPRVGVMILPGDGRPGMLEDLCLAAVQADPVVVCVDAYFACLERNAAERSQNPSKARVRAYLAAMEWFEERHVQALQDHLAAVPTAAPAASNARLHAFLASRYKPDLRLGTAAQAGYWPLTDPAFQSLVDFLHML